MSSSSSSSSTTICILDVSKLSLQTWIHSIILWTRGISQKHTSETFGVGAKTMVDVYNFYREVCQNYFFNQPDKIAWGPKNNSSRRELFFLQAKASSRP
ncbi:hypothetical protein DERP_008538 [Dermatophagoides pteronyssinus]|uniref:Uncharacterized protein n=1 Tax=Dermatophagoides pteronyssinus TaxID=6956 RepID=A0ABQ8IWK2_DERPT|nr:hypothetical protein DERP_008538 [Dermatophagoides pteronyssinus]